MSVGTTTTIARLMAVYGEPRTTNVDLFLAEYHRVLAGYDAAVLAKAVAAWIDSDTPYWPRPGELRTMASRVAVEIDRKRRPAEQQPIVERPPMTPEQRARHEALMAEVRTAMAAIRVELGSGEDQAPKLDWKRTQRPAFGERRARLARPERQKVWTEDAQ